MVALRISATMWSHDVGLSSATKESRPLRTIEGEDALPRVRHLRLVRRRVTFLFKSRKNSNWIAQNRWRMLLTTKSVDSAHRTRPGKVEPLGDISNRILFSNSIMSMRHETTTESPKTYIVPVISLKTMFHHIST